MDIARPLLTVLLVALPSLSVGQPSTGLITASDLIGCWDHEPGDEKARQDEQDGFADAFELCFDELGAVEAFNLGGSTEYGIEGYSDVFTYTLDERLTFSAEHREDGSCFVRIVGDVLELHDCHGSYFDDGIFHRVSDSEQIRPLFAQ